MKQRVMEISDFFFFFAAHEIKADLRYQDDDVYIIEFRDYFQVF